MNISFLEDFGKAFIPKMVRPNIHKFFLKAGIVSVPYGFFGALFFISLAITYFIYFQLIYPIAYASTSWPVFLLLTFLYWVVIQLAIIGVFIIIVYEWVDIRIYNRTRRIEEILPEFLRYVSENLKGGMSFDRALWSSIRPQFGVLSDEIRLVAKKVVSGDDVEEALVDFSKKYDSMMVTRSIHLIVETMRAGGDIASVIDSIEDNLRQTKELKDEMNATNLNYFIFLSMITVVIAPLLFALSYNLLSILRSITGRIGTAAQRGIALPLAMGKLTVQPEAFANFSVAALIIISVFVSLIIAIIRKGSVKAGIRYVPIFTALSVFVYFALRGLFSLIFHAAFLT